MDTHGFGWGACDSGKSLHYSKGGYFQGSKNGGAELHSVIAKFGTGVQVAAVNGDLNFARKM